MNLSRMLFQSLGRRLPVTEGELACDGLTSPVTIRRDEYGIPHIDAANDYDAWFGLGFCQGQDRTFQLEMIVRLSRGTLSELIGVDGLGVDRLSRRAGVHSSATRNFEHLDPGTQTMFSAYSAGVNAGRKLGLTRLPHEFSILRATPTDWEPTDPLAYFYFITLSFSNNWLEELARYMILQGDGAGALEALEPGSAEWLAVTNPPGAKAGVASLERLLADANATLDEIGLRGGGSNNWAISGERTVSGRPILANDQHLAPSLPADNYLAHVQTPEWQVAGGSFVGTSGFYAAHNGHAAWGVTIGYLDTSDLFIEEIGPDGQSVREGNEFVNCDVREEHIRVKGADDVVERVLETSRGPIIGPALDGSPGAISLCAAWKWPGRVRSLPNTPRWRCFDDARRDLEDHPFVSLNVAYADTSGDIGWMLAGRIPQRKGSGAIPLPARDLENHWVGPPKGIDERLVAHNPVEGFIATANNRPIPNAECAGFGVDWAEGYRVARIQELLAGRDDWDLPDMGIMHLDTADIAWREIKPIIENVDPRDDDGRVAKAMLMNWDGELSPASRSATIFVLFTRLMLRKIAQRAAPMTWEWALGQGGSAPRHANGLGGIRISYLVRLLRAQPGGWFDAGWDHTIAHTMGDALRMVRARSGRSPRNWGWGMVRPHMLRHVLGRGVLARVFNRGPYAVGGGPNTINAASVSTMDPFLSPGSVAAIRMVIDVGEWENCRFVLLGGQSGNPLSPHYDDQIPVWQQGRGVPIAWSPAAVENATRQTLRLLPAENPR